MTIGAVSVQLGPPMRVFSGIKLDQSALVLARTDRVFRVCGSMVVVVVVGAGVVYLCVCVCVCGELCYQYKSHFLFLDKYS